MIPTYSNYSPMGDVITLAASMVLLFLVLESFLSTGRRAALFRTMIAVEFFAAASGILYHFYLNHLNAGILSFFLAVYFFRDLYHTLMFGNMALLMVYLAEYLDFDAVKKRTYNLFALFGLVVQFAAELCGHVLGYGFRAELGGVVYRGTNIFLFAYIYYMLLIGIAVFMYRDRIIRPVMRGMIFTFALEAIILLTQGFFGQSSLTTASFLLPILALTYLVHSSPYDLTTGALSESAFDDLVKQSYANKRKLIMITVLLSEYQGDKDLPKPLQIAIFKLCFGTIKSGHLFKTSGGALIFVFDTDRNPDPEVVLSKLTEHFLALYDRFRINYRTLIIESRDELKDGNEYISFIRYLEPQMNVNNIYRVTDEEIEKYTRYKFILSQLEDIERKKDLNDERILVYCQPVYNVMMGEYDTAEALMRMQLPKLGFIFPDQFIPLAESAGMIHSLSLIILNKTCAEIRRLLDEGYKVNRISVNFSIMEVHDDAFCDDIIGIIRQNDIPYEKIAIELTESRNSSDFEMVKQKVNILKSLGIKFYLDDFGTGYSNFDRIMELPVDIIKFDRSLVIESSKDKDSEYMVYTFADMFNKLDYHVLYEGIETPSDERRCIRMFAQYLQGYKYSKPIPIEQLREFLSPLEPDDIDLDEAV